MQLVQVSVTSQLSVSEQVLVALSKVKYRQSLLQRHLAKQASRSIWVVESTPGPTHLPVAKQEMSLGLSSLQGFLNTILTLQPGRGLDMQSSSSSEAALLLLQAL
jgi:hypothetical protein